MVFFVRFFWSSRTIQASNDLVSWGFVKSMILLQHLSTSSPVSIYNSLLLLLCNVWSIYLWMRVLCPPCSNLWRVLYIICNHCKFHWFVISASVRFCHPQKLHSLFEDFPLLCKISADLHCDSLTADLLSQLDHFYRAEIFSSLLIRCMSSVVIQIFIAKLFSQLIGSMILL